MGKLRYGFVGVGGQGSGWVKRCSEVEEIEIVGVCDIRKDQAKNVANKYNVPFQTTDYEELLKQNLDVVVIATPHFLHAPMTIRAAEEEVNIFCEKPMATSIKQTDDMIRAVRQNDVKLAIGHQHRFNKNFILMKNAISKGQLGQVFQINTFIRWYRTEAYYEMSAHHWRGRWESEGGSVLTNQGIHEIDTFQWLGGAVQNIQASANICFHEFQETEDNVNAVVNFKSGGMGLLQAGVVYAHGGKDEVGVYGTEGAMIIRDGTLEDYRAKKFLKEDEKIEPIPKLTSAPPVMDNLIRAIKEDDTSIISVDGEEGKKSIEIVRGIYMSIMNNGKVSFPVADNGYFPSLGKFYKTEF